MKQIFLSLAIAVTIHNCLAQPVSNEPLHVKAKPSFTVIAYYSGDEEKIDQYPVEKLTHIIYSFCHLKDNKLVADKPNAYGVIKKLVSYKQKYPALKILLSLGGWGGCKDCSEVFSTAEGRNVFVQSTKELIDKTATDGIDLDWEYPAIEGHPGHRYVPEDKQNFTELVKALRKSLGRKKEISFAAGGFHKFLVESIEWNKVMPLLDRVNIMSYDLVNGYSPVTGHHTPLYSTDQQLESTDHAVRYLDSIGVPLNKMVIGAAFYARVWENVDSLQHGLYQPGKFRNTIAFRSFENLFTPENDFIHANDDGADAAYSYSARKKLFATYDHYRSVRMKTRYAILKGLNGIMFWELTLDKPKDGLLDVIDKVRHGG